MKRKTFLTIALLCTLLQGAWAWDGSGTSADPYLIKSSSDWKQLADNVRRGNSYSGTFFEMATDIDAMGISVGASDKPFSGTFSGGMYTLTYDRGEAHYGEGMLFVNDYCAPFILLDGATIRDLKVTGAVYSGNQFAAGIAVMIDGNAATTISSCYVSSELCASYDLGDDASFGGLVGTVSPLCTASPTIENCVFTGLLSGSCTRSAGMVGYAQSPVNFEHCMFDPVPYITAPECANFVRTKEGVECTFKECYYTLAIGTLQGEAVFRECQVPEGCSYRIVSEADAPFNGVDYYKSGAVIELTAPDDMPFNHWETNTGGCWISNPWQRSGRQTVRDIYRKPSFQIETSPTNPHEEREMDGIKYRYLNRGDYHYYISDETVEQKSYHFNERGELFKWDVNGNKAWVTAITGWVPGDIPSGGAVIYSDLKVVGRDHTLTPTIAPCAFQGCQELRTLFFKDTGSNTSDASFPFDFTIGDRAFAYCGNLTEIKMMQYTTKGDNHWEALRSDQVSYVGDSIFFNSPHANFTVDAALYQIYLSSQVWRHVNNRILIYNHTDVDMKVNGALYCEMRNTAGEKLKDTLAEKLGLYVEWSYSGLFAGDKPRYIHGQYAKYDSLTVSGQLNDLDLWVIRYLAGNSGYERGGKATDGRLSYLNLYDASIKKDGDCKAHYLNLTGYLISEAWHSIEDDDELPPYLFQDCTALETVILPKSLDRISHDTFKGCTALKRLAVTGALQDYDGWQYSGTQLTQPLQELVMLTSHYATSTAKDPWGAAIQQVYTYNSTIGDYMNDASLTMQAQAINAPFKSDRPLKMLAYHNEFFPSEYLARESVEGLFTRSNVDDFEDFDYFQNVKRLEETFEGCGDLRRITLPASVEYIGRWAFTHCGKLDTIHVRGIEPAELAEDAFRYLPKDFRIFVPRRYAKLYRTKWAEYADHINADEDYEDNRDIITVTVTEPNTLAKALGLEVKTILRTFDVSETLSEVRGDYSNVRKLKVVGPIGALDLDLLRYMAGYCPWSMSRNYVGRLEYLDLYDAQLRDDGIKSLVGEYKRWDGTRTAQGIEVSDDELPKHAFLRAYNLKTLILPKTCKEVRARALQECEGLETLVIGDDMENFNWNALDDDAMLTRMYILAKKKPQISTQLPLWRLLCNNYNPTFDAFYVRPSQYANYLIDEAYTGSSWQRTNNISTGVFDDDESFCAFASHGAATMDELAAITSVRGWFDQNTGLRNLAPLRYTCVGYLDKATLAPLKELEQIAMPITLYEMEEGLFDGNRHLRSVDFLMCDSTEVISNLRDGGFAKYGINTQQTLAYVPATYGPTDETNVITVSGGSAAGVGGDLQSPTLRTKTFRLVDSLSYVVPYEFEAEKIENPRPLAASAVPYTICVPYKMKVPEYSRAYKLSARDGNSLVFTEVTGELEAMHPYLLKVVGNKRFRKMSTTLNTDITQTIPASGVNIYGKQDDAPGYSLRGTLDAISNADAANYGAYILQSDGDWHPVVSGLPADKPASILPFRAFLLPSTRNARTRISMSLEDEMPDIDSFETIDEDGTHHLYGRDASRLYDLNGRELQGKPDKGIYIYKGKKVKK